MTSIQTLKDYGMYVFLKESGDKYKGRAAAEVMKSVLSKAPGVDQKTMIRLNRIGQESKQELEKIRSTPELEAAYVEAEAAYKEYYNARQETINVSNDIGAGDPLHPLATNVFAAAIKRVQEIDGEIRIFEPDDPHVTGKFSKTMP